jgi:hypothetical protein
MDLRLCKQFGAGLAKRAVITPAYGMYECRSLTVGLGSSHFRISEFDLPDPCQTESAVAVGNPRAGR